MLDIGWSELLVIGVVALIVVGPKDLPVLFRRMGEVTGKARAMAREFSRAMEQAADEAGVKDLQTTLKAAANPRQMGLDAINKAAEDLENWDPDRDARTDGIATPKISTPLQTADRPAATPAAAEPAADAAAAPADDKPA
ncbi:MAG: twin-arginine translocase subunit TatB [Rhodobacteraceae bacterium]|nr:twin-arginine translocase subunit TatB [Paracoccaceae bacterium]